AGAVARLLAATPSASVAVPGANPGRPPQHRLGATGLPAGRAGGRPPQEGQHAHLAAQVRHAPAGSRYPAGHRAETAGAQPTVHHAALHAHRPGALATRPQSAGYSARSVAPCGDGGVSQDGLEVGTLLARFARPLSAEQRRAVMDLSRCRTPALGGTVWQCSACGRLPARYRSCGHRPCPHCQGGRRAAWLEREAGWLLPVAYHHLVFTLPRPLAELARANARLVYGLLFAASGAAVQELAADPKYLGAQVGLTAVLHTWGQTLSLHPHVHMLASGGGLSCDRSGTIDEQPRWRACRPGFFLPVRVLSRLFRGQFLYGLWRAQRQGVLGFTGT